jgi:pyruvate-formate lyase-activating enzyme
MTVSIQFCGGCNPRIDRGEIALALQKALADRGFEVVFNRLDADFVIFLSGCTSGCAFKFNPTNPPYVTIAGTTVDNEDVGETRIVPEVLRKVKEFYGASGHF